MSSVNCYMMKFLQLFVEISPDNSLHIYIYKCFRGDSIEKVRFESAVQLNLLNNHYSYASLKSSNVNA